MISEIVFQSVVARRVARMRRMTILFAGAVFGLSATYLSAWVAVSYARPSVHPVVAADIGMDRNDIDIVFAKSP